jgi:uncharacterized phage protein (TIGR02218 family)
MKTISDGLKAALAAGRICTLFTIISNDGDAIYLTEHDLPLVIGGNTYTPSAGVTKFMMKMTNNAEVSSQQVTATVLDMPDDELLSGKWDGAKLEVAICSWENVSYGKLIVFAGSIGAIQWTDEGFLADIQNNMRTLAKNMGSVVSGNCRLELYSTHKPGQISACLADKPSNTITGSISYVLTPKLKYKITTTGKADAWGTQGFITFTSGVMNNLTCQVKIHSVAADPIGEAVEFYLPALLAVQVGDTFTFSAGCDHTFTTCQSKFSNAVNFGGFPHLQPDVTMNLSIG